MKKLVLLLAILCASLAHAQTVVTGTFKDTNGVAYAGATLTITQTTASGSTFQLSPSPPNLSSTGAYAYNIIAVSGSTYTFTASIAGVAPPAGTGPQTCKVSGVTISGSAQTVSSSGCAALLINGGGTQQVSSLPATCAPGSAVPVQLTVANGAIGAGVLYYCDSTNHYSPVSQGSGASPIMGFYLSPQCPPSNSSNCYYTPANTQEADDCGWASTGATVTCSTSHFVATDVGKRAFGYQTCAASVNLAANSNNNPMTTTGTPLTIATFVSGTQVTLSGNPASTVTVSASFPQGGCFIWGTPDDTGAAAIDAAVVAASQCPKYFLAAGYYMFTTPHFYTQPTACAHLPQTVGASGIAGNIVYSAGFEVEGRGTANTVIFLTPGFPETGGCTHGLSGHGCFVVTAEGKWTDLQFSGGGNATAYGLTGTSTYAAAPILFEMDGPATLQNFVCTNFGAVGSAASNNLINGVGAFLWSQLTQVNLSACGTADLDTNVSSSVTAIRLWIENFGVTAIQLGSLNDYYSQTVSQFSRYNFICYDCTMGVESLVNAATPPFSVVNEGLKVKWYRGGISTESFNPVQTQNGIIGYYCQVAGCELDAQDAFFDLSAPATGTGYIAIDCAAACTNIFQNSIIKGTSGGNAYQDVSGSKFISEGGNTYGSFSVNSGSALNLAPSDTLTSSGTLPSCTFTTGGGSTPSCTVQSGSTNEKGTIIATTGTGSPGSTGTITLSFVGTYTIDGGAPMCVYNTDNSGTAWGNESGVQINSISTTAGVVAWHNLASGTLTALTTSSPYRISYSCVPR